MNLGAGAAPRVDEKRLREFILAIAEGWPFPLDIYLLGGSFMVMYRLRESSVDIDFGFRLRGGREDDFYELVERVKSAAGVSVDMAEDPTRWAMIEIPAWRERCSHLYDIGQTHVHAFHPVDVLLSKVARGTQEDWDDIARIMREHGFPESILDARFAEMFGKSMPSDEKRMFRERYRQFKAEILKPRASGPGES